MSSLFCAMHKFDFPCKKKARQISIPLLRCANCVPCFNFIVRNSSLLRLQINLLPFTTIKCRPPFITMNYTVSNFTRTANQNCNNNVMNATNYNAEIKFEIRNSNLEDLDFYHFRNQETNNHSLSKPQHTSQFLILRILLYSIE